ncbi:MULTISPECIES: STAS-like domain-containing protein [Rufibacter]|uniref:DNA-binding NarL/FixJ family response regulator n=1 Tax=Rufibacter quisquiliarum TaxID=1549639 RepID=A0A839GU85_9BACT|nr:MULTISPECIES: STAS-like domain-containing protein [Rufibacter]MBA9078437.1 DNA-binding NarL/FixJ family response regulator [Rufibacter quisquiliarum]
MQLSIAQIIGKQIAVLDVDGLKVYEKLQESYKPHEKIVLSFEGLRHVTSAFLNAALGRFLLSTPQPEEAKSAIELNGIDNRAILNKVNEIYKLALDPKAREIRENARNQELGIHE